jgi:hypothetical protein
MRFIAGRCVSRKGKLIGNAGNAARKCSLRDDHSALSLRRPFPGMTRSQAALALAFKAVDRSRVLSPS